ncbi:hypothetical protein RN001_010629 [Aquatica leii]|uniref:Anoctamin n=1 Tax=Aquatica leii TaxID=1421715 RepID=A0AAN7P839_9COLE|nr:hypothetical protein RN001_010629 [Aquatica leii]
MYRLLLFSFNFILVLGDRYYDFDYPRVGNAHRRYIDVYNDAIKKSYNNYKGEKYVYPKTQVLPYKNQYSKTIDQDNGDEIKFNSDVLHYDDVRQPFTQKQRPKFKTTKNSTDQSKIPRDDSKLEKTLNVKINDILKSYFYKLHKKMNQAGATWGNKEELLEDNSDFDEDIETLPESSETAGLSQNLFDAVDEAKTEFNNSKSKFIDPNKLWMIKNSTQFLAKKFLSLFTIIKFPNTMCTGSNGVNVYDGTCYYESECQARNGTAMGSCADGYGVCCVFIRSCGATSGQNCSYFESPSYPNYYPSNGTIIPPTVSPVPNGTIDPRLRYQFMVYLARQESTSNSLLCEFQVTKASNAVRQLRVDFLDFELRGPTNGTCTVERLVITGQNQNSIVPAICGYNTGQHLYIDVTNVIGPVKFSVIATVVERKRFRIKVCQITECSNPLNCLQYLTGTSGIISSFNYDQASSLSRSTPGYFNNLNYAVCIRKETGYCSITYTNVANGTSFQFQLVNFDDAGVSTLPPGQAGAEIFSCPDDYIIMNGVRLCGERLNDGSITMDFTRNAPVTESSRRPSNESTCSLNVPFGTEDLTQITSISSSLSSGILEKSRSLVNISKVQKQLIENDTLNGIEENSAIFRLNFRRGSLQNDKLNGDKKSGKSSVYPITTSLYRDAFGPQLSNETLPALPGTPLPSLVHDSPEYGFYTTDLPPLTPVSTDEELDPNSLYFRDGKRRIDMVLAYEEEDLGVMTEAEATRRDQRKIFQENLIKDGLELELEHKDLSFDGKTWFLKIHLPWKTQNRYAEVMGLKLPIKRFITISVRAWDGEKKEDKKESLWGRLQRRWREFYEFDYNQIEETPSFYTATKGADPEEQFIVKDRETNYSSAQRSLIVMQILLRVKFDDTDKVGIRRLLNDSTYCACFPLHEGRWDKDEPNGHLLDRRLLYLHWGRPESWHKKQPLSLVRKYFGDKIALYFCWLGFYTKMLYAPAVVGTLCFLYGLCTMDGEDNIPSKEICDRNGPGNITLCPMCDKACRYQKLMDSCKFARLTYLFDNPATVFFAIFMSIWATLFLELWRRKQSMIQWEWDLQGAEQDEEPRPEFETSVKTFRTNPVTREKEPYLPSWSKTFRFLITSSAVFFMMATVMCAVLGTIIYRLSLVSIIYSSGGPFLKRHAKIFTSITAALMNLIIIMILTKFYHRLAIYLTNLENPRTQTEYEDSYTFKIFLFEFLNFYSSLIYIAFFKGRFFDYPGDTSSRSSEFLRVKTDICDPAGCLSELCIQLAIIMIGKQMFNNIMELLNPKFYNWWRRRIHKSNTKDLSRKHTRWEQDYHLQDPGRLALFDEYLEMILQYGFVTLFVAAFPLAPLCALLNNIAEIRLDAYKMVTQARRPLADRIEDIGAWYGILRAITYLAVVSNAFVIAYTSEFIPRMVYKYRYSKNEDLVGYIDASLSVFNTSHYDEGMGADMEDNKRPPEICQYRGYRNGPNETSPYGLSLQYYHVSAARLAFIVIFEHIVFALTGIMQYMIPDVSSELKTQIQRESLLAKEAKYEHGLKRDYDYDEVLHTIKDNNNGSRLDRAIALRGSWARRLSKISDGLDAHVNIENKRKTSGNTTVWEVT